jgi:RimJ/RimL family protein N-acetyltransferase
MHTIYTGRKVRLRPVKDKDELVRVHLTCDSLPNEHWGPHWHPPQGNTQKFDEHGGMPGPKGENIFIIERIDTGEAVGLEFCGLMHFTSLGAWFGTDIAPAHRGQGFGKEAKLLMLCHIFENYPVHHVGSDTVADHWWARKGMEACGMTLEGRLTARLLREGLYYDVVWYGIERPDWEKLEVRIYVRRGAELPRPGVGQVPTPTEK